MFVELPRDEEGFIGRECPAKECLGYFKVKPGTGLTGHNLPCHCPYCGLTGSNDRFFTPAQIEFAHSVAINRVMDDLAHEIKALEFPQTGFLTVKVTVNADAFPIHYYREKRLETEVICESCKLDYVIYGVFGFCPDCGAHNSLQILKKNLDLVAKMVTIAQDSDQDIKEKLIENALEDCVSTFDGFGRNICSAFASKATSLSSAREIRFQNLNSAAQKFKSNFAIAISDVVDNVAWELLIRCFQKRHLLAHKLGVVDAGYVSEARDTSAVIGRKISISPTEIVELSKALAIVGEYMYEGLRSTA